MQSNSAIALFTKLKLLYEKENKFLAFPPATVSWKSKDLSFLDINENTTGPETTEKLTLAANFAKGTNFIAETSTILNYEAGDLWDIYQTILDRKLLASNSSTPAEEARKQELRNYLTTPVIPREDGTLLSRQSNYDIYQSTYYEILNAYNNKSIEAQYSNDEKLIALWKANEPIEKSKVNKALNEWVLKGFRPEVDNAMNELTHLSTKGTWKTWEDYRDDMVKSLITKADLGGTVEFNFYSTSFYPSDFYLPEARWNVFTLTKSEIDALSASAPAELKALQSTLKLKSLSAEIAYVDIRRPWCHTEIFSEHNWKLPVGESLLSDGGNPAAGRIPAIPVAIIFARKVKVEIETSTGATQQAFGMQTLINTSMISNLATVPITKATSTPVLNTQIINVRPQITQVKAAPATVIQPQVIKTASVAKMATPSISAAPPPNVITPAVAKTADLNRLNIASVSKPVTQPISINKTLIADKIKFLNRSTVSKTVRTTVVNTPPIIANPPTNGGGGKPTTTPTPTPTTTPPQPAPAADLEIVAFVCQRLPLCPSPDPSLVYS